MARSGFEGGVDCQGPASTSGRSQVCTRGCWGGLAQLNGRLPVSCSMPGACSRVLLLNRCVQPGRLGRRAALRRQALRRQQHKRQGCAQRGECMQAHEYAEKLDGLMDLVLGALAAAQSGQLGASIRGPLLRVFEAAILPAHRTKFCQYLLWSSCAQVG